jgi:hypothetical protein
VKEENYERLYETAGLLKMSVLTKLMDAQVPYVLGFSRNFYQKSCH